MESFADETDIALFKVSNAAVREFRGAARGPFREIRFLTSKVRSPRDAASTAVPRPVAPPPMTKQSQTVERSEIAWIARFLSTTRRAA
jgi:hypothetical protein